MVNTKGQDVVKIQKNHGKEAGTAMTAPQKIHAYEYGIMFLLGCFIYSLLEIAARGYTHWTMTLLGGIVGMLLYAWHSSTAYAVVAGVVGGVYHYRTRNGGWCVG